MERTVKNVLLKQQHSNTWYSWLTTPITYVMNYIRPNTLPSMPSTESLCTRGTRDSDDTLVTRNLFFENSMRLAEAFEEQFISLSTAANLFNPSNDEIPEYSLHNVYVPTNIEDWSTFVATLPDRAFPRYKMLLPKKTKILALDLDETLVHSTSKSSADFDFFVEVLVDRSSCLYYVYKRPFVDHFLETVSAWYHLVIYTASLKEYAEPVVSWLDRGRGLFIKKLYRSACIEQMGMFVKNLLLVDADLTRVCLVDNSPTSFLMNPDNGIPIESWTHDRSDTSLLDMLPLLDALRFTDDVRSIISLRRLLHNNL